MDMKEVIKISTYIKKLYPNKDFIIFGRDYELIIESKDEEIIYILDIDEIKTFDKFLKNIDNLLIK